MVKGVTGELKIVIWKNIASGSGRFEILETWNRNADAMQRIWSELQERIGMGGGGGLVVWDDVDASGLTVKNTVKADEVERVKLYQAGYEVDLIEGRA